MRNDNFRKPNMKIEGITDAELAGLDIKVSDALVAHVMGGLSYDQVAANQQVPVGTVKSRINRALNRIQAKRDAAVMSAMVAAA
jgi:DNA-directed RNA polymerase specialized sigma24 family protein